MEGKELERWLMGRILREKEALRLAERDCALWAEGCKGAEFAYREVLDKLVGKYLSNQEITVPLSRASS